MNPFRLPIYLLSVCLNARRCPMLLLALLPQLVFAGPGDVDLFFTNGTGANAVIFTTKIRTNDNKIYIGGTFDAFNGAFARRIARLSNSGALDTTLTTLGPEGTVIDCSPSNPTSSASSAAIFSA